MLDQQTPLTGSTSPLAGESHRLFDGIESEQKHFQFRILILALAALGVFALLIGRLFYLQIIQGELYLEKARSNRMQSQPILAPRGNVYDATGKMLATNKESHAILFDPRKLSNPQIYRTLQQLSQYLETDFVSLREQLDFENLRPVYIYHDLSPKELALVVEHKEQLEGVQISTSLERHYPVDDLMVHFLGHMGQIGPKELKDPVYQNYYAGTLIGKNGLERLYEPFLKGQDGKSMREIQLSADAPPVLNTQAPNPGHALHLTIDRDLQRHCYQLLERRKVAGSIVVMNPKNGELKALASYPSYDPNLFNKGLSQSQWEELQNNPLHPFLDRSTNSYAPGSIFKVVTTLAGLGTGALTPERSFYSRGFLNVNGHIFHDWNPDGFGQVDIYKALAYSIDTVYYELALEMGIEAIRDYAKLFELGEPTGIDLPAEGKGIIPDKAWKKKYIKQDWVPGDAVNASIGQGYVQMTPLQAARMVAAVANDGWLVRPHLVSRIGNPRGRALNPHENLQAQKIPGIPPRDWRVVQDGLEAAVTYGTAKALGVPGVRVAGKTGTAETIPGKPNHAWIVGYAPVEDPQYAVVVFLEYGGSGGGKAAPVGHEVFKYLFQEQS